MQVGLFFAGLNVIWFLSMVPSAIAAGAMPALTREALRGAGAVRRRTAATLALVPSGAAGLAQSALGLLVAAQPRSGRLFLLGRGLRRRSEYAVTAAALAVMAVAVPAMFLNAAASPPR